MHPTRALSNQDIAPGLQRLALIRAEIPTEAQLQCRTTTIRARSGVVQGAVLAVLAEVETPQRPAEIRKRVEQWLGREVSPDTVSSFLSVACRSTSFPVERVQRGLYRITR
jgi:hypothetical protein